MPLFGLCFSGFPAFLFFDTSHRVFSAKGWRCLVWDSIQPGILAHIVWFVTSALESLVLLITHEMNTNKNYTNPNFWRNFYPVVKINGWYCIFYCTQFNLVISWHCYIKVQTSLITSGYDDQHPSRTTHQVIDILAWAWSWALSVTCTLIWDSKSVTVTLR